MRTLVAALLLTGCVDGAEDAWLLLSARSADGKQVARLWCPNLCDVDENVVLTVSPATPALPLHREVNGFPAEGTIPVGDTVWQGSRQLVPGRSLLRWRDQSTLTLMLPCIAGAVRGSRWRIVMADGAVTKRCRA